MTKNEINEKSAAATVLTDERIKEIVETVGFGERGFTLRFARAIEREVLAHTGVTAEPAAQVPAAEVRAALKTISEFPVTDPGNMDAWNMQAIAINALAHQSTADKASEVRAVELNMNERFSVTLTAFGAQARNNHYAWMREKYPEAAPRLSNEGDVLNGQLWELMKIFGQHGVGMPEVPFKGNVIRALAAPSTADSANTGALGEKGAE